MYFKQLSMTGFKSFADKTQLKLEPGITAIVGPNGCGKSNVLDALRWALGEQSAKELRGAHMQDVVFNGSDNRQPMGMAEVSVTFDNADGRLPVDFAEVEVTRRVYRSGESEYLINKAPCRLRDIQEMFMDTGIGTNAYSTVSQGKMDSILSSKPDDRRYIFEEAAGIIKYKTRKRTAMRKLDAAEHNLQRLHDIIAEVERQMRSLKRQVNAAIRYRELSEQLRDVEIRAAWLEFTRLTEELTRIKREFAEAGKNHEKLSARIGKLEARSEELSLAKLETDRTLLGQREEVHALGGEMERIERSIALYRQQKDFAAEQQQTATEEAEAFRQRAAEIESQSTETGEQRGGVEHELVEVNAALEEKTAEHETVQERVRQADAAVETARAQTVEQMNARNRAQNQLDNAASNLEGVETQLAELEERRTEGERRREELQAQLDAAQERNDAAAAALAATQESLRNLNQRQDVAREEFAQLNERWQKLREKRSSLGARLTSLRELRDNYEGFANGVRAVMKASASGQAGLSGIVGPAGDLLSTDTEYERAIEAALGGNINNIVVEQAEDAKDAVAYLKQNRAGRVTFLPLDIIRGGRGNEGRELLGQPGVVAPAIDVVRFEERLRSAAEYLLHSTLIVETLDDAIRIARQERRYPRLVTLQGEVVSSSGAVTGGATRHESRGLLGRSAEIEELEGQEARIAEEVKQLGARGQELTQTINDLVREIKEATATEDKQQREANEAGVEVARLTTETSNLAQSAGQLTQQRQQVAARRDELVAQRDAAYAQLERFDRTDASLEDTLQEARQKAEDARRGLAASAEDLADLRVRQAELTQRTQEHQRAIDRQKREHAEALQAAKQRTRLVDELEEKKADIDEKIAEHVESSKGLSEKQNALREKVVQTENERQKLLDESDEVDGALRTARDEAKEAQSTVHRLELELRSHEDRLAYFDERIQGEYHVALASLTEEHVGADDMDMETRNALVSDLRKKIERLGNVNLMAIDEYEALEKRHNFLLKQAGDLEEARDSLMDVVARSDKRIREMFMDTFHAVSNYFVEYFRQLFNGGQARVYLTDEEDPLECGIEIEARPPGKKPQSISLLSGGESAMTATALLFSIFKARPSPFCVLDEVDAPLDDANVGRFVGLLEEFTADSQFIVITHNKQTMARADALYGVTMQERGVSQLVSVQFNEEDESGSAA